MTRLTPGFPGSCPVPAVQRQGQNPDKFTSMEQETVPFQLCIQYIGQRFKSHRLVLCLSYQGGLRLATAILASLVQIDHRHVRIENQDNTFYGNQGSKGG